MIGDRLSSSLRIYLTGRVTIETSTDLVEATALPGRQGRLAFALLASSPRRLDRDHIAEVIWGSELPEAWESSLAAIVSKTRKVLSNLGLDGTEMLQAGPGSYELRLPPGTWVDLRVATDALDRAEGAMRNGRARVAWSHASVASTVFRRTFLAGEHGAWVEHMRRDLHEYEIRTFDVLSRVWLALDDPTAALQAARRALDLAPYRETAHARVMEAHLAAGNRAEALRVYAGLRELLSETMGIEPSPQTELLYEQAIR